ncbi:hypothetical protein [Ectobacillus polymachus]|uniref:hypothetical protein n=1 Tax=Ectobacillus polymachus TaxID=1508806 RepID=UPI003A89E4B7
MKEELEKVLRPMVLSHQPVRFETSQSGGHHGDDGHHNGNGDDQGENNNNQGGNGGNHGHGKIGGGFSF